MDSFTRRSSRVTPLPPLPFPADPLTASRHATLPPISPSHARLQSIVPLDDSVSYAVTADAVAPGHSRSVSTNDAKGGIELTARQQFNTPRLLQVTAKASVYKTMPAEFWEQRQLKPMATWLNLVCWNLNMTLSAALFSWNTALYAGWAALFISTTLYAIAFMVLSFSLAELSSALPFSGGSYGYCRSVFGTKPGLLIACFESLEYILTTVVNCLQCSSLLASVFHNDDQYAILYDILILAVSTCCHCWGGKPLMHSFNFLAALQVLIFVLYICGTFQYMGEFAVSSSNPDPSVANLWLVGGMTSFMRALPTSVWWYVGVESMGLAAEETYETKSNLPSATIWSMVVIIVINFFVLFTVSATPVVADTSLLQSPFPLLSGFALMFNNNSPYLLLLMLPSLFDAAYAFIYSGSRQIFTLSRSNLLPTFLSITVGANKTPINAIISTTLISALICVVVRTVFGFEAAAETIYNSMLLCALTNYVVQLFCFIRLRRKYPQLNRQYYAPTGRVGAYVAIVIFAFGYIALLGWTDGIWKSVVFIVIWSLAVSSWYFLFSDGQLTLSSVEQSSLFLLYTMLQARLRLDKLKRASRPLEDTITA